ncbi:MAG TPA: hypothetical protein VE932_15455 [Patescibacteria group bacterium]|nr:hypothetical protein [Patescibacteria group bacterium]
MKALVAAVAFAAALVGGVGALPLLLEARLATLAPGGLAVAGLHYNPFSGRLTLRDVSARDEAGREIFRADVVDATASLGDLLGAAPLTLQRVNVVAPRLVVAPAPALTLIGLGAAGLGAPPVVVDGIVVSHGALVLEEPGGRALVARDLTARLDRLAALGDGDAAFAVETALYGTDVRITGQPLGRGAYALRFRANGLDAAALLEDFPQALAAAGVRLAEGRADVDATLVVAGSRVLASGQVRVDRLVARFAEPRSAPLTASALVLAVDRWDLAAGAGRISRLELQRPVLTLDRGTPAAITALVDWLAGPDVMLRRLRIVDGTVRLAAAERGERPVTLRGLTLGLQAAAETGPRAGFVLTARAGVGPEGRLTIDGALSRNFRRAEGAVRAIGVTLEGCGLDDVSVPLPVQASPAAVLGSLAAACR